MTLATWIERVGAGDRELLGRWAMGPDSRAGVRRTWIGITQAGSAGVTIGAVLLPMLSPSWPRSASWRAGATLAMSHVAVQVVKRFVGRPRPEAVAIIRCPDRFSFPSGHAAASLAVALSYGLAFPPLAIPLLALGVLVGWSRVVLGVHYPGDVAVGQLLAVATALGVQAAL